MPRVNDDALALPKLPVIKTEMEKLLKTVLLNAPALIDAAYEKGQEDEREHILILMKRQRYGLNAQRGGRRCEKPYLQNTNAEIDFLDKWIAQLQEG